MYYDYGSSNIDTFQDYFEIAVCNKDFAKYNTMKNSGFWIPQLTCVIPDFFETAAFNGGHTAVLLQRTAVSPNCGVTIRG